MRCVAAAPLKQGLQILQSVAAGAKLLGVVDDQSQGGTEHPSGLSELSGGQATAYWDPAHCAELAQRAEGAYSKMAAALHKAVGAAVCAR